jgi:hypothetical protein
MVTVMPPAARFVGLEHDGGAIAEVPGAMHDDGAAVVEAFGSLVVACDRHAASPGSNP